MTKYSRGQAFPFAYTQKLSARPCIPFFKPCVKEVSINPLNFTHPPLYLLTAPINASLNPE